MSKRMGNMPATSVKYGYIFPYHLFILRKKDCALKFSGNSPIFPPLIITILFMKKYSALTLSGPSIKKRYYFIYITVLALSEDTTNVICFVVYTTYL